MPLQLRNEYLGARERREAYRYRDLARRDEDEDSCSDDNDEKNDDKRKSDSPSMLKRNTLGSNCVRGISTSTGIPQQTALPPIMTGAPPPPPPAQTVLPKSSQGLSLLPPSISSFPSASMFPMYSSLDSASQTTPLAVIPSGSQGTTSTTGLGLEDASPLQSTSNEKPTTVPVAAQELRRPISPATKNGLVGFGVIVAALLVAFISWVLIRRKRKQKQRGEEHAYSDIETIFRSNGARSTITGTPEETAVPITNIIASHNFSHHHMFNQSDLPQQPGAVHMLPPIYDPFADPEDGVRFSPVPMRKESARKDVGEGISALDLGGATPLTLSDDPFENPGSKRVSSVKRFHTTPSWVIDQTRRLEND